MMIRLIVTRLRGFVCFLTIAMLATSCFAQQDEAAAKEAAPPPVTAETFKVPNTDDVDQLAGFLADLITFNPKNQTEVELFTKFGPDSMNASARRILQLEKDRNSDNYKFAEKYLLAVDAMMVGKGTQEQKTALMTRIDQILNSPEMDADDLDIAVTFAETLEMSGDKRGATAAYMKFAESLKNSKNPLAKELSSLMMGAARRLNLVGNQIAVVGTTIDGKAFDWSQYKGKVVLIDFWATWCKPCIEEFENVRKVYADNHASGFEVVGICMDQERAAVDKFMKDNQFPWAVLHENGSPNPTAVHYGIASLPTTILVGKDGKVISMSARGQKLGDMVKKLHGDR